MQRRRRAEPNPAPAWPDRTGRTRVLVEDADGAGRWATENLLEQAGYDVMTCGGPEHLPDGRCRLVATGGCELVEGADVVLNVLRVRRPENQDLLRCIRGAAPTTPLIVGVTPLESRDVALPAGCQPLVEPASGPAIRAAVERAATRSSTPSPPPISG